MLIAVFMVFMKTNPAKEELVLPAVGASEQGGNMTVEVETPQNETQTVSFTIPGTATGTPQLKVTSFDAMPLFPKTGDVVTLAAYVKNVGDKSPVASVEFYANDVLINTANIQALDKNVVAVTKTEWTVPSKGDYLVKVKVVPVPGEKALDDNEDKITFTVSA